MQFLTYLIDLIKGFMNRGTQNTAGADMSSASQAAHTHVEEAKASVQILVPPKFGFPALPIVTSNFGWRVLNGQKQWHPGIDWSCSGKFGAEIKSPEDGVVILNKKSPQDGLTFVAIKGDHSNLFHYLCHTGSPEGQASPLVKVGDHVKCGQVVGYSNNTGMVFGAHNHHGVYSKNWYLVDPVQAFYVKYAPELMSQITGYVNQKQLDPSNKSGRQDGGD